MTRILIIFALALSLSGCLTKSSHTKNGDMIVSRLANVVAGLHPESPEAKRVANEAAFHASKSPAFISASDINSLVGSVARGDLIGAGMTLVSLAAGAYGLKKRGQSRQLEDLALSLTDRDKAESQAIADAHPLLAKRRKKVV